MTEVDPWEVLYSIPILDMTCFDILTPTHPASFTAITSLDMSVTWQSPLICTKLPAHLQLSQTFDRSLIFKRQFISYVSIWVYSFCSCWEEILAIISHWRNGEAGIVAASHLVVITAETQSSFLDSKSRTRTGLKPNFLVPSTVPSYKVSHLEKYYFFFSCEMISQWNLRPILEEEMYFSEDLN